MIDPALLHSLNVRARRLHCSTDCAAARRAHHVDSACPLERLGIQPLEFDQFCVQAANALSKMLVAYADDDDDDDFDMGDAGGSQRDARGPDDDYDPLAGKRSGGAKRPRSRPSSGHASGASDSEFEEVEVRKPRRTSGGAVRAKRAGASQAAAGDAAQAGGGAHAGDSNIDRRERLAQAALYRCAAMRES